MACGNSSPAVDAGSADVIDTRDAPVDEGFSDDGSSQDGGSDSANSICPQIEDRVDGCLKNEDGALVMGPIASDVTLTQIEDVPPGDCHLTAFDDPPHPFPASAMTKRLVLTSADMRVWIVFIRMPNLPDNFLHVGDALKLSLEAFEDQDGFSRGWNQTFVLFGGGALLLAATLNRVGLGYPALDRHGIRFEDDGIVCHQSNPFPPTCAVREHRLRITIAGESAVLRAGESGRVGRVDFAMDAFLDRVTVRGGCDAKGFTQLAGFYSAPKDAAAH
jgi:hypothetical protein